MTKSKYVFVVTMYRYGDHEKHSYVLGAFDGLEIAKAEADKEQEYRGGNKYMPEIIEMQLNVAKKRRVIWTT